MSEPEPIEVFSLAQYLAEEMEERDWNAGDVGIRMGGTTMEEHQKNILVVELFLACHDKENLLLNDEFYRPLERAFGVSAGFFERLHADWLKYPDRRAPFIAPEHLFSEAH